MKSYILTSLGGVLIFFFAFLTYSEADNSLIAEGHLYIEKYLERISAIPENKTYDKEIDIIIRIQNSVISKAAHKRILPLATKDKGLKGRPGKSR